MTHSSGTFGARIRPIQAESYASATLNRQFCGMTDGFEILDQRVLPLEHRLPIRLLETTCQHISALQVQPGRCFSRRLSVKPKDHSTPNPF